VIDLAIKHLIYEEGLRLHPYLCPLGYWTIGVGHLIDCRKGGMLPPGIHCFPISEIAARQMLTDDIHKVHTGLVMNLSFWKDLSKVRQVCLISMAFQMGIQGLLGFKNMILDLSFEQWKHAAAEMLDSRWAKQTPKRARRISEAMRTNSEAYLLGLEPK
jgi:lysozyme